jgi:3'-5' exonuclease
VNLFIDIETIPTQRDAVRDYISSSLRQQIEADMQAVRAPSNYKDADKIAAYVADKRKELQDSFAASVAEKIKATGLDGSFGHICCIGWACDDELAECIANDTDERVLLQTFAERLRLSPSERFTTTVIGHNVSSFDLRFLTQRYIVNGIRPPMAIARAAQAKPWESDKVYDTMIQWAGVGGRIGLDKLCLALSVPSPKGDMDGSMVAEYVAAGRIEEVAEYCKRDVEAARAVWRRMTFATMPVIEQFEDVAA